MLWSWWKNTNYTLLYFKTQYLEDRHSVKYLTTFIWKGHTAIYMKNHFIHLWNECQPLPHTTHSGTFHFSVRYDLYLTVVVFVSYLIYHFSYMLFMLDTVFSLASFKAIRFFSLLSITCQSFLCAISMFADLPASLAYINFLWAIAKPYCYF